ncbi:hypothetical protein TRM7615_03406 [Falsiruegeria mediterranea M17]|uniref:Uncharacterized protein n=1 Tax=Falsiruegeria mediterranea M17 TaxID=1200281 RepID=A0A2R8CBR8_9RHOB|nr:hypothetical protein TRM7615_03406 [Falsiruegeria mediterranea M17]
MLLPSTGSFGPVAFASEPSTARTSSVSSSIPSLIVCFANDCRAADVYVAPDTPFGATVFAGIPLAFTLGLDTCAVDQQVQRARSATVRDRHIQRSLAATQDAEVRHTQSKPISFSRLCTNPVVCRNGMPNNTFIVRHVWIATSLKLGCRPRLPAGGARAAISGSNQIVSDPRRFNASL